MTKIPLSGGDYNTLIVNDQYDTVKPGQYISVGPFGAVGQAFYLFYTNGVARHVKNVPDGKSCIVWSFDQTRDLEEW